MQYDLTADQIDDALNGLTKSLRRGAVLNPLAWYETTVEEDAKAAGFDTVTTSISRACITRALRSTCVILRLSEEMRTVPQPSVVMPTGRRPRPWAPYAPIEVLGYGRFCRGLPWPRAT